MSRNIPPKPWYLAPQAYQGFFFPQTDFCQLVLNDYEYFFETDKLNDVAACSEDLLSEVLRDVPRPWCSVASAPGLFLSDTK